MGHTPGPWKVATIMEEDEIGLSSRPYPETIEAVDGSVVSWDCIDRDVEQMIADARLIAAAPELLEACRNVIAAANYYGNGGIDQDTIDEVAAAIAKAEASD